jgi:signal transduction histidine kinase
LQAQARCYAKAGNIPAAVRVSGSTLQQAEFAETKDAQGRLITPNALLYALQLRASGRDGFLDRLVHDLNDYTDSPLPSQQRAFLMRVLIGDGLVAADTFPTLAAEQLANRFLDQESTARGSLEGVSLGQWILARFSAEDSVLTTSLVPDAWRLSVAEGRTIFLFDTEYVAADFDQVIRELEPIVDFSLRIYPGSGENEDAFASTTIGGPLPGWRVDLKLNNPDTYERAADNQLVMLFWVGSVCGGLVVLAGSLSARAIGKQARLARMKNDLVATVSHELKTPIASVKVLVDTLFEGHFRDEKRLTE